MAVKIDDEMIDYVGILAKLSLSPEEKEAAKSDMSRMLEYIDMLNQLDTSEVEPMSHVFDIHKCSAKMSWKMEMNQMRCFRMHQSRKKNSTRCLGQWSKKK